MSTDSIIADEYQYGAHHYAPLPVVLTKGQGVYVWDKHGKRYLDMMGAYSAVSHGHCHPRLVQALVDQAQQLTMVSRAYYTDRLGSFLKSLSELSGFEKVLPMNTGVEAVETAIKAARKWGYTVKGIPADCAEIIVCAGNFHGRTTTVISFSSEAQYRQGFGPFTPGFTIIPYGDVAALASAITPHTAAFLVEPIQGEGGIIVPPEGYLRACYELCQQKRVLMICDEVQTGLGRTGKLFAFQHEGIQPDAIILGKALGGGLLPVSAFLAHREVMDVFTPGDHGSTFGGNPLAAAVATMALNVLVEEQLVEQAFERGIYFKAQLQTLRSPLIHTIRGRGLLMGIEIDKRVTARALCLQLLKEGMLSKETHQTVIRLAPPLIITHEQINEGVQIIQRALDALSPHLS